MTALHHAARTPSVLERAPTNMFSRGTVRNLQSALRVAREMSQRRSVVSAAVNTEVDVSRKLETLNWDHTFIRELPADPDTRNVTRQVLGALYTPVSPTPTGQEPSLVAYSAQVAELLDLSPDECERPEFPLVMAGETPLPGSRPYAQCYGGHQFGQWAGQLGDGRAITLGEVTNSHGERWELQLKGAGKTPYSRHADGRAVLRSSIREFIASEAMHHLGVPTTRALCVVGTGASVYRDMFYNGNGKMEPGAVVCRVAPSFIRFGTFQLPVSRGLEEAHLTIKVADYVIKHHYPHLEGDPKKYLRFLEEVTSRTAQLVACWQSVGFVHGVLNTDNMSILGLTIDYGPFGFLDKFDPYFTPNLTDMSGKRYTYRQQPEIGQWNLIQLAQALMAVELVTVEEAKPVLEGYSQTLLDLYNSKVAAKMGLQRYDKQLALDLMKLMYEDDADFTNTFRALATVSADPKDSLGGSGMPGALRAALGAKEFGPEREAAWAAWLQSYRSALASQDLSDVQRRAIQNAANPKYIPRQHLLQYAIEAAEAGDYSEVDRLYQVLRKPYEDAGEEAERYCQPPPESMIRAGVTCLSCSS